MVVVRGVTGWLQLWAGKTGSCSGRVHRKTDVSTAVLMTTVGWREPHCEPLFVAGLIICARSYDGVLSSGVVPTAMIPQGTYFGDGWAIIMP